VTGSFRFGASNQQTAGTERIYVGQNGAVGIDDANSLSLFVAHAPATGSPQLGLTYQFRTNDNTGGNLYGDAIRVVKNAASSSTYTVFTTNSTIGAGTERMRIDSSGNIGIGNTTALHKVQIGSNSDTKTSLGQSILFLSANAGNIGYVNELGFGDVSSTYPQSAIGNIITNATAASNGDLYFATRTVTTDTAPTERMRITNSGSIGIGTSSPGSLLSLEKAKAGSGVESLDVLSLRITGTTAVGDALNIKFLNNNNINVATIKTLLGADNVAYGTLTFSTRNYNTDSVVEVMRCTNRGALMIGSSTTPDAPGVFIGGTNSSYANIYSSYSGGAAGMLITNSSNVRTVEFFGSTGNYYFAGSNISDRRSKTNIQEITSGLPNLLQLKPSTFAYNNHPNNTKGGFIAQEVQEILPDFVTVPEDETEMMGVDYNGILALAVKAIQELKAEIEELKNR
jgi:hypothetical protein